MKKLTLTIGLFIGAISLPAEDPIFRVEGFDDQAEFGYALTFLGDINHDGFEDFAVGEPNHGARGRVRFYSGTPTPTHIFDVFAPVESDRFGASLDYLGVDGQIIIGDPNWDADDSAPSEGAVFVYDAKFRTMEATLPGRGGFFGEAVASLRKPNGVAGRFVVGASNYSSASNKKFDGMFEVFKVVRDANTKRIMRVKSLGRAVGASQNDRLGYQIAAGPSIPGSVGAMPDFCVAVRKRYWNSSETMVYAIDTDFFSSQTPVEFNIEDPSQAAMIHRFDAGDVGTRFGHGLDIHAFKNPKTGEQKMHLVVGAPEEQNRGRVKIFKMYGNYGELPGYEFAGLSGSDELGINVQVIADVNGDKHQDILVGDIGDITQELASGAVHLLSGATYELMQSYYGGGKLTHFGRSFAVDGDLNQDHPVDFLVGGEGYQGSGGGLQTGAVWGYAGQGNRIFMNFFGKDRFSASNDRLECWISEGEVGGLVDVHLYSLDGRVIDKVIRKDLRINPFTRRVEFSRKIPAFWVGKEVAVYASYRAPDWKGSRRITSPIEVFEVTS